MDNVRIPLGVQVSPRKKVFVTFEEDTFPNKGGYFCQTYYDLELEFPTNISFTIPKRDVCGFEDRLKQAKVLAAEKVKRIF